MENSIIGSSWARRRARSAKLFQILASCCLLLSLVSCVRHDAPEAPAVAVSSTSSTEVKAKQEHTSSKKSTQLVSQALKVEESKKEEKVTSKTPILRGEMIDNPQEKSNTTAASPLPTLQVTDTPLSESSVKNLPTAVPTSVLTLIPTPTPQLGITGEMHIKFDSRIEKKGEDKYEVNLTCADALRVTGEIKRSQLMKLFYSLNLMILNPVDKVQQKNVGSIMGEVLISKTGAYDLSKLEMHAESLSRKFGGKIQGKAHNDTGILNATYTRLFGGKKVSIRPKRVDPLRFEGLRLPSGPLAIYPATQVTGNLDYDYDTGNWLTSGILFRTGEGKVDRITGSIKWSPDSNREQNGKGRYEFNLRFNEDQFSTAEDEGAFFESLSDEEAFFAVDDRVPTLKGSINYKDTFGGKDESGEPLVLKSDVIYALQGNKVTKEELINFLKLWLLIVGPVNDE